MDGEGNIQVNKTRKKNLEFRFIIKLNNSKLNYSMLVNIVKILKGKIRFINNKKELIWVIDDKETIKNVINIFKEYPPLTSRLICQLKFLKICLADNSEYSFLNYKYFLQLNIIKIFNNKFIIPQYFPYWLSGYIESKGCFLIKVKGKHFFLLEQKNDYYLLNTINNFFNLNLKINNPDKTKYSIDIYKKESLNKIINHCITYPLLGQNLKSLKKFLKVLH